MDCLCDRFAFLLYQTLARENSHNNCKINSQIRTCSFGTSFSQTPLLFPSGFPSLPHPAKYPRILPGTMYGANKHRQFVVCCLHRSSQSYRGLNVLDSGRILLSEGQCRVEMLVGELCSLFLSRERRIRSLPMRICLDSLTWILTNTLLSSTNPKSSAIVLLSCANIRSTRKRRVGFQTPTT